MREILYAKSEQCDLFRPELVNTQNRKLTHILHYTNYRFWTTQYNKAGKTVPGEDVFAVADRSKGETEQKCSTAPSVIFSLV